MVNRGAILTKGSRSAAVGRIMENMALDYGIVVIAAARDRLHGGGVEQAVLDETVVDMHADDMAENDVGIAAACRRYREFARICRSLHSSAQGEAATRGGLTRRHGAARARPFPSRWCRAASAPRSCSSPRANPRSRGCRRIRRSPR